MKFLVLAFISIFSFSVSATVFKKVPPPPFTDPKRIDDQFKKGGSNGQSSHGITNIGNGGGLAEMRLIYLHQNLDRFLKICLNEANSCHLSDQMVMEWQSLVNRQPQDGSYVIAFLPKIEGEKGFILEGRQITISSQMLYADLETPKPFGQILAFLIAVRQDVAQSKNSFTLNLKADIAIFANLRVEESLYRATGIPSLLRLAQLKVNDGAAQTHFLFSIEDKDKTLDLTEKLANSLPCGKLRDWNFSQWNSSIGSVGYFYGYANGQCDGVWQQKRIVMQMNLSQNYIIDENTVSIQFFVN